MTDLFRAQDRPLPAVDAYSMPYWRGGASNELLYQRCDSCGSTQFYPRPICTTCGATPTWVTSSGRGVVHSFTVIRQNHSMPFKDLVPYVVALIEVDGAVRMMGNVLGCDVDDVHIGLPVKVHFERANDEVYLPFWVLADGDPGLSANAGAAAPDCSTDSEGDADA